MSWYKIELSRTQIASGELDKIIRGFIKLTLKLQDTLDSVGVFASKYHNEKMFLYFTPKAIISLAPVLGAYVSVPCNAPSEEDIEAFVFGDESCWQILA